MPPRGEMGGISGAPTRGVRNRFCHVLDKYRIPMPPFFSYMTYAFWDLGYISLHLHSLTFLPIPSTSSTPIKMSKTFSLEDVVEHNSGNSLWIVVHNKGEWMIAVFSSLLILTYWETSLRHIQLPRGASRWRRSLEGMRRYRCYYCLRRCRSFWWSRGSVGGYAHRRACRRGIYICKLLA